MTNGCKRQRTFRIFSSLGSEKRYIIEIQSVFNPYIYYLLQEIGSAFSIGAFESTTLEELDDVLSGALVHNVAFRQENDVVEKIECFRGRLKKRHENGGLS